MDQEYNWFQCPICTEKFDQKKRRPMIMCMSQHTACSLCIEDMFKCKNKKTQLVDCYLCRRAIKYSSVTPFYWLKDLNETKEKLQMQGSQIKKINGALATDIAQLQADLKGQKQKNEWLIQLLQQQKHKNFVASQTINFQKIIDKKLCQLQQNQQQQMKEQLQALKTYLNVRFTQEFQELVTYLNKILVQKQEKIQQPHLAKQMHNISFANSEVSCKCNLFNSKKSNSLQADRRIPEERGNRKSIKKYTEQRQRPTSEFQESNPYSKALRPNLVQNKQPNYYNSTKPLQQQPSKPKISFNYLNLAIFKRDQQSNQPNPGQYPLVPKSNIIKGCLQNKRKRIFSRLQKQNQKIQPSIINAFVEERMSMPQQKIIKQFNEQKNLL